MKKLGIIEYESARPSDWSMPALSEFNFLHKLTFQQGAILKPAFECIKMYVLKEVLLLMWGGDWKQYGLFGTAASTF